VKVFIIRYLSLLMIQTLLAIRNGWMALVFLYRLPAVFTVRYLLVWYSQLDYRLIGQV